jgi:NAD(P)H-hydrate epimerase
MIPVLLKKQAYKLDKDAVESGHVSEDQLMDNAGFSLASHVLEKFKNPFNLKIGIIVGKGNNGVDGIIAHYYLSQWNCSSKLILIDKTIKKSLIFSKYIISSDEIIIYNKNINFIEFDLVIDGILGIGNSRKINSEMSSIFNQINKSENIISIDLASGLMANNGMKNDNAINANQTHTMGYPKLGHFINDGLNCSGKIIVHHIGLPKIKKSKYSLIEDSDVKSLLKDVPLDLDKYSSGKLLVIGGSNKYIGAAELSSIAGYRTGAGYVKLVLPTEIQSLLDKKYPELIVEKYNPEKIERMIVWSDSIVFGPGLDIDFNQFKLLINLMKKYDKAIVFDASAFDFFDMGFSIDDCPRKTIFTPHQKELKKLFYRSEFSFKNDITLYLDGLIKSLNGRFCLIKGQPNYILDNEGKINLMNHGSSILATAGTGDVLSGVIGSLIAQGYDLYSATVIGSWIHAEAGEIFVKKYGNKGLIASELLDNIPSAFRIFLD